MEGVDYSFSRPSPSALKAAGKKFVVRYLTGAGKSLSIGEKALLQKNGLLICVVFESTGGRAKDGYGAGKSDAAASRQALAKLDMTGTPVYFAVDFDVTDPLTMGRVKSYLDGAASVLGRAHVGVYGEADVIDACVPQHAGYGWQTYAWSRGRVSQKAHLLQYRNGVHLAGGVVDLCRSLKTEFGQWPRPKPQPKPPPQPVPPAPQGASGKYLKITDKDGTVTFDNYTKAGRLKRGLQFAHGKFRGVEVAFVKD